MSDNASLTLAQKRKAVLNSLLTPALDTVLSVMKNAVDDILLMLKRGYRDTRSARTQLNAFYNMYPEKGKEASSFAMDLHKSLMDLATTDI